ncbi:hypothetical protein [Saccharophagus degradans]|nr:hypothetical protein [Saccharophagus degradans]
MLRYLYELKSHDTFSHIKLALPFVKESITSIDEKVFDVDYLDGYYYSATGEYVNSAGQECMREVIAGLNGYDIWSSEGGEHKCHDIEFERELKKVFETEKMQPAYYRLLDFIHEHKENCI